MVANSKVLKNEKGMNHNKLVSGNKNLFCGEAAPQSLNGIISVTCSDQCYLDEDGDSGIPLKFIILQRCHQDFPTTGAMYPDRG